MKKLIRTLEPVAIYAEHSLNSKKIRVTTKDEYLPYNRIKLREKIRWYEVVLDNEKLGYIKKDSEKVFKCSYVEMNDDQSYGFNYNLKEDTNLSFYEIFFPKRDMAIENSSANASIKSVEIKQIKDIEKNKMHYIDLYYDSNIVEVDKFFIEKKEKFHLTYEPEYSSKSVFIEVNNFKGKKGFLLKKTSYTSVSDKWITYLGYVIMILCTVATFLACLATGLIVIGFILIIPGLIIGFIVMFAIQLVISILKGIFNEIYVRL